MTDDWLVVIFIHADVAVAMPLSVISRKRGGSNDAVSSLVLAAEAK
jgi:hypothetical protein